MGIFKKFGFGLKKTREGLDKKLEDVLGAYEEITDDLYDDLEAQPEFFAGRELLLIPITEGSSSTAYQPEALRSSGTDWTLTLRRLPAEMGVDSMGYWHLALTIPDVIPPEAEISLVIAQ